MEFEPSARPGGGGQVPPSPVGCPVPPPASPPRARSPPSPELERLLGPTRPAARPADPPEPAPEWEPLPPMAAVLAEYTADRRCVAGQMPQELAARQAELEQRCSDLAELYERLAGEFSGRARAQVLRHWLERQGHHLCRPPVRSGLDGSGEWEAARADVMLSRAHVDACVATEKDKAAACVDELHQMHEQARSELRELFRRSQAEWAERVQARLPLEAEVERIEAAAADLAEQNAERRAAVEAVQSVCEMTLINQQLRQQAANKRRLLAHLEEAKVHEARLSSMLDSVNRQANDRRETAEVVDLVVQGLAGGPSYAQPS